MMLEPAWRLAGPSEIIDAPDCLPECATERGRWYACSRCDHVRGYGQPFIFPAVDAGLGAPNLCPECFTFVPRYHDCTCDLIQAETCDYCHGYPCQCP